MKLFTALSMIALVGAATASFDGTSILDPPIHSEFKRFLSKYNKYYPTSSEYAQKLRNFAENYEYVNDLNEFYEGYASFEINSFADLDVEEFSKYYARGSSTGVAYTDTECEGFKSSGDDDYPDEIDWRDHNAVTGVKNQGQCGSCWSFSSTGAMEGAWAIATDNLVNLSQQELMDCSWSYGDFGCHGGLMDNAFKYAIENGMCSSDQVSYLGQDELCSNMPECDKVAYFTSCVDVTPKNELHLMEAVSTRPVSVAIEADTRVFQFYKSGILNSTSCGDNLDHGVLVVGYGIENGVKYWIVKNSWGSDWGEDGYIRIARTTSEDSEGTCGIAMTPSYIVV